MARDIRVKLIGDDADFRRALARSGSSLNKFASTAVKAGGAAGIGALALGLRAGIKEYIQSEKVAAQTNAVIASTGGVAGVSAKHIDSLSQALLKKSGTDDEVIKSGANMLLTFTNIRNVAGANNDIFDQATKATLDLSVAMGKDMTSSAILVGKALQDPIKGMTALTRAGIQFTEVQKDAIKHLVATGNVMAAQKIILGELTTQFGGSAKAAGDTLPGQLNKLRETFNNLAGSLVGSVAPALEKTTQRLTDWLSNTENQQRVQRDLNEVVKTTKGVIEDLTPVVKGAFGAFKKFADNVGGAKNALELLGGTLAAWKLSAVLAGIGTSAGGSAKKVGLLRNQLKLLGAIGVITVAIEIIQGAHTTKTGLHRYSGLGGWANLGHDLTGGLIPESGSGSGPEMTSAGAVTGAAPQTGRKQKNQGAAIAATAQTQLGIPYTWGGPAILGQSTDCSGLAQAVLAKNGIHVGRTTYEQWKQGRPTMQPQPGDLVFFHMGPKGPEHVGVYIGDGNMIHDPHTGDHVRVEALSNMSGYCGARTYVTQSSGGGAPTPKADAPTSGASTKKTTAKKIPSFDLPVSIKTAIAQASLTVKDSADDLKALAQAKRFIESKLGSLKGEQKLQALDALKGINDQISGIEDTANSKRLAKQKAAQDRQKAALKAHLDRMKAIVAEKTSVFEQAFSTLIDRAMAGFDRATAAGLAGIQAQFGAQTPEEKQLADFQAKRAADDLAKTRADALAGAATDEERQALALGYSLDDQEAALKDAADQSRTNADKQMNDAQNAYQDLRDLQKQQLQAWLDDQQRKLETGKSQWADFWNELVVRAGMAGVDTGSAFWKGFSAAGSSAQSDLGAVTTARVAQVMSLPGGGPGPLDPAIAAAILARGKVYDSGGWLPSGGLAMNLSGKPEAVLTGAQLANTAGGGGGSIVVNMYGHVGSADEFAEQVRRALLRKGIQTGRVGLS